MKHALLHYSSLDKTTISQGFIVQYCCGIQGNYGSRLSISITISRFSRNLVDWLQKHGISSILVPTLVSTETMFDKDFCITFPN